MLSGILESSTNTGSDSDIRVQFTAPLNITSKKNVLSGETLSLRRIVSESSAAQRWEITAGLSPLSGYEFIMQAFFKGYSKDFFIHIPQPYRASENYGSNSPQLASLYAAGVEDLTLASGTVVAGTFIQFTGQDKVYFVAKVVNQAFTIVPRLQAPLASLAVKTGAFVTLRAKMSVENINGITFTDGILPETTQMTFLEVV